MQTLTYEKDGRIGRITLNRPDVMNAINDQMPGEIAAAVALADADPDVHVMVLAGNGPQRARAAVWQVDGPALAGRARQPRRRCRAVVHRG